MGLLAIGVWVISDLGRREKHRLRAVVVREQGAARPKFKVRNQAANVFASKHLKIIAAMTVATFVTVPLIDYQFKVLVKEHFTIAGAVDTDAMSAFMGLFSAVTGVVAAVMQLVVTGRLLERFGIVAALLLLPVSLLTGLFGMLTSVASAFACAVFTKGAENSLRYSITDATMQVLYTPVPSVTRGRAKTFIDGVIKPLAGGAAGTAMVLIVGPMRLPLTSLAVVAVVLVAGWIGLIMLIRSEYVKELLATLRKRRLDFSDDSLVITDVATVAVFRQRLLGCVVGCRGMTCHRSWCWCLIATTRACSEQPSSSSLRRASVRAPQACGEVKARRRQRLRLTDRLARARSIPSGCERSF